MIIGIHPDQVGAESYSTKWTEFLQKKGISVKELNLLAPDALDQVQECDGVMWRWLHNPGHKQSAQKILLAIETCLNIPVYPDHNTIWHFDEKNSQYYLLKALGAPMPDTWLFWDYHTALDWARKAQYPVIFKLSSGAGSSNILKMDTPEAAEKYISMMFTRGLFPYTFNEFQQEIRHLWDRKTLRKNFARLKDVFGYFLNGISPRLHPVYWKPEFGYAYFQEYLSENRFDTRISLIGNRAFGFRRFNRPDDFRASGSGLIDYNIEEVDLRCVELAFEISRRGNFQSMAYDFLSKNGCPVVVEISYGFADWAVEACPGHWDSNLNWIEGHMWPEEAQVEDFVARIEQRKAGRHAYWFCHS